VPPTACPIVRKADSCRPPYCRHVRPPPAISHRPSLLRLPTCAIILRLMLPICRHAFASSIRHVHSRCGAKSASPVHARPQRVRSRVLKMRGSAQAAFEVLR